MAIAKVGLRSSLRRLHGDLKSRIMFEIVSVLKKWIVDARYLRERLFKKLNSFQVNKS